MLNNLISKISLRLVKNFSAHDQKKMENFPKAREHLINKMIKNDMIKESSIKHHGLLITFFGCGKVKHGPGTFASLITVILWFAVTSIFFELEAVTKYELLFWLTISTLLFIYGMLFIPIYSRFVGHPDHSSVVIDEVVGQLLALCLTYPFVKEYYFDNSWFLSKLIMFGHIFSCFILFRFLDIAKPSFIGWIDRNIKNSFGVMVDDIVCGLLTALVNIVVFLAYETAIISLHTSYNN